MDLDKSEEDSDDSNGRDSPLGESGVDNCQVLQNMIPRVPDMPNKCEMFENISQFSKAMKENRKVF